MRFKKILMLSLLMLMILGITGCGEKKTSGMDKDYYVEGAQEVVITIEYEGNLLLAKENMDIYIDNHKFYTVKNGDTNVNLYMLTKGTHVLKVATSTYHYTSEEFEVTNTGDYFDYSIKNRMNSIELSKTDSGNAYTIQGFEIPETVDDSDKAPTQSQVTVAKKNLTVWSYLWMGIKAMIIFGVLISVIYGLAVVLYMIFDLLKIAKIGLLIGFIGVCVISAVFGITINTIIFPISYLIFYRVLSVKEKSVPEIYKNFHAVNHGKSMAYSSIYAMPFTTLLAVMPGIISFIPITIVHLDWYMYVCLVAYLLVIVGWSEDIEYPEKVRQFVNEKGTVTEEEMTEFIMKDNSVNLSDSMEDADDDLTKLLKTLVDLAKAGLIEMDEDGKCFRKKE